MLAQSTMSENKLARIDYLDIFRSFGIIAMVVGHIWYVRPLDHFIHAFHMPMFFWISGFLFRHKSKEEQSLLSYIVKKAKTLLLPYCIFGIAHYIFSVVISPGQIDTSPLIHLFSVNTYGLPICGALWFLTALFFTDLLFFLIDRYITYVPLKIALIACIALVGSVTKAIFPFTLPFALGPSLVGVGLYYIGHLCRQYASRAVVQRCMNLSWISTIIFGAMTTFLIFTNGYINMREESYAILPLFWINAFLSIVVGINLAKLICKHIQNTIVGKWLIGVGQNSIVYVCFNQVVIFAAKKGASLLGLRSYVSLIFILVSTLVILWFLSKMIMNTKLRILVGK